MSIPSKPSKTLGDFTVEPHIPGSTSEISRAYDNQGLRRVCLRKLPLLTAKQHEKLAAYRQVSLHPSHLKFYDEIVSPDGEITAVALEHYEEDLSSFIDRRRQSKQFLTPYELVSATRMLVAGIANYHSKDGVYVHGNISLRNIVYSRNGQNQVVFKIGFDETISVEKTSPVQDEKADAAQDEKSTAPVANASTALEVKSTAPAANASTETKASAPVEVQKTNPPPPPIDCKVDVHALGIALCQLVTLNPTQDIDVLRVELGAVRTRYQAVVPGPDLAPLFDIVLKMIDPTPDNRPIPKNVQIALANISIKDEPPEVFKPSVVGEDMVPAGFGDTIVKRAQGGDAASQYQLALLLRERGHAAQAVAWCQKAAEGRVDEKKAVEQKASAPEQKSAEQHHHVRASALLGFLIYKGEGTVKDFVKAEIWLRRAAEKGDTQAQEVLSDLLWDAGKINELLQTQPKMRLSAEVECELGLMFLSGRGDIPQEEKTAQQYLQRAAERGNATAQLFLTSLLTENLELIRPWLEKTFEKVDQHISHRKSPFVLAAIMAILKRESATTAVIHSSKLQASEFKTADVNTVDIKQAIRCQLRSKKGEEEEEVEVRSLHEDITEATKELIILDQWPENHDHLQPIRGFCADFKFKDKNYPLVMVVPHLAQGSVIDFFSKSENHGKAKDLLLPWAMNLAAAIESLHEHDLIHGDISARTVLIDDKQIPTLAVSRHLCHAQENRTIKVRRGADQRLSYHLPPCYEDIAKASDIFAFGLTLFEIATEGNHPLYDWTASVSDSEILSSAAEKIDFTQLAYQLPTSVPEDLKNLIFNCLDKDPTKRPTAFDLVEKLGALTQTTVIHAHASKPDRIERLYEKALVLKDTNPKSAGALLLHLASLEHRSAMLEVAEMLWSEEQVPADKELAKKFAHHYCALLAKSNGTEISEEKYQTALTYLPNKEPLVNLMNVYLPELKVNNLVMDYAAFKPSYSFALMLLREAADSGHSLAHVKAAEMLWSGIGVPQNKALAIQYLSHAVNSTHPEYLERLQQMIAEHKPEAVQTSTEPTTELEQKSTAEEAPQSLTAAGMLRLAFQHFFGLDVLRDLVLARDYLVNASKDKKLQKPLMDLLDPHLPSPDVRKLITAYALEPDSNMLLARAILSLSTNPLNEQCPLRFYVPGDDFQAPFTELEPAVYRVPGRAFRCSIVGRIGVLLFPKGPADRVAWLKRSAHAHPNVIGPIGVTAGAKKESFALLYAPVQAASADHKMVADPTTASSRVMPYLVGLAEGLAHLHRSHVVHGNVSLKYTLVGHDRLGLIATAPPDDLRATAPESLTANEFSTASDVFHFGLLIANILTGGSYEDGWVADELDDPVTRLARLCASAASGYADIRARIPQWVQRGLVDIMLRCLRLDPTQRPKMDAVATELQTLRASHVWIRPRWSSPAPQFWLHTSHVCGELTADDTMLREGGVFECLYGSKFRDRMRANHNPDTDRCRTVRGKDSKAHEPPPSAPEADIRKILAYKAKFFKPPTFSSPDDKFSLEIRHFAGHARGAMLLDDGRLKAYSNQLDRPPQHQKDKRPCSGASDKCKCERAARPKKPDILTKIPAEILRRVMSFLEVSHRDVLAKVSRSTAGALAAPKSDQAVETASQAQQALPTSTPKADNTSIPKRTTLII